MPVYNDARFLRASLDSALSQTVTDFELIISDNESSDGTEDICREYVKADSRIRYFRQKRNIGAPSNWNFVVRAARGEYFKGSTGDDPMASRAVELGLGALRGDASAVVAYGRTQFINEDNVKEEIHPGDIEVMDERPSDRFRRVQAQIHLNHIQNGLLRMTVLRKTRLDRPYPSGDLAFLAELALHGKFILLPEVLLWRRRGGSSMTNERTPEQNQRVSNPLARAPLHWIKGRYCLDLFMTATVAPIPLIERLRACDVAMQVAYKARRELWREFKGLRRGRLRWSKAA